MHYAIVIRGSRMAHLAPQPWAALWDDFLDGVLLGQDCGLICLGTQHHSVQANESTLYFSDLSGCFWVTIDKRKILSPYINTLKLMYMIFEENY
jgi:hypothetical protein